MGMAPLHAQTATETVLYNFAGSPPTGAYPRTGLIRDSAGALYGTAGNGGMANAGVVFKLNTAGVYTILHNFTGGNDGSNPGSGLVADHAGNLYGTTVNGGTAGGTAGQGVVYKLDPAGAETVLYTFTGLTDGGQPYAGVIRDAEGNLYGTTVNGNQPSGYYLCGVVYKLSPDGTETVLHTFGIDNYDGWYPLSGVIRDPAGNLYGTTEYGGATASLPDNGGAGAVFKLDPAGNETLYSFSFGAGGYYPAAGIVGDGAGNFYGTASAGGPLGLGAVYEFNAAGNETVLYGFQNPVDGQYPYSGVIGDSAGNLYGTTYGGGTSGAGVVYKLDAARQETVLYTFTGGTDGGFPWAGVIRDTEGNLYGTASGGGLGYGVVYKVSPSGQETVLYAFTGGADGASPLVGVIRDSAGNLFRTTAYGGTAGVVFKVDPSGQETVLYTFTGGADGGNPYAGVIRDPAGNLYGTTISGGASYAGVVFKLSPSGQETVLYSFTGGADGGGPDAGVIRCSAGKLCGTTQSGGTAYWGVVFELDAATGQETVLYSFTGGADGGNPAAVICDQGNLYGVTYQGGGSGQGVVFEVNTSGQETVVYSFPGGAAGGWPNGVVRDTQGNLYGTTYFGGIDSVGVVFEIEPQ